MYLDYNTYPDGNLKDIDLFLSKFPPKEIQNILNELQPDDYDELSEKGEELQEWIQEGMKFKGDNHQYLNKIVVDNLLGIGFRELKEDLVVYRTWGVYSGYEKDLNYNGWISISTNPIPYYSDESVEFERFVLPKGFFVCNTKIDDVFYADKNELIVRNEDLVQL